MKVATGMLNNLKKIVIPAFGHSLFKSEHRKKRIQKIIEMK
jgi:hypothetical protein